MSDPYFFEAVILTTQATGTPHAGALQAANPGLKIHVCEAPDAPDAEARLRAWRNCDNNLLTWWREHGGEVAAAQVLALEWDVYCNTDLRTVIRPPAWQSGLAAARILSGVSERRKYRFFEEAERLPASMRALAVAAAPLAVLRVSRTALDACLAPEYADVFREDIFCEMRLPTVIRHAGFHVAELGLRHVDATPKRPAGIGIFHPVKEVAA